MAARFRRGAGAHRARALILLAAALLTAGIVLLPLAAWPFWLGMGAALSAWNFYSLALFVQHAFPSGNDGRAASSAAAACCSDNCSDPI